MAGRKSRIPNEFVISRFVITRSDSMTTRDTNVFVRYFQVSDIFDFPLFPREKNTLPLHCRNRGFRHLSVIIRGQNCGGNMYVNWQSLVANWRNGARVVVEI